MSMLQADHKQPRSSDPRFEPYRLAVAAQMEVDSLRTKIVLQANLIRQLMVHRVVRHRESGRLFMVTEIRLVKGKAMLRGKQKGRRNAGPIGALAEIDIIPTGGEP